MTRKKKRRAKVRPGIAPATFAVQVGSTWKAIGPLRQIVGPSILQESVDVTLLGTRARKRKAQYLGGLIDTGNMEVETYRSDTPTSRAAQDAIVKAMRAGVFARYRVSWPALSTAVTFAAYCECLQLVAEVRDQPKVLLSLKITGAPTWT